MESRKSSGTLEFDCALDLWEHKSHSQQFYGNPPVLLGAFCSKIILWENSKEAELCAVPRESFPFFSLPLEKQGLPLERILLQAGGKLILLENSKENGAIVGAQGELAPFLLSLSHNPWKNGAFLWGYFAPK